MPIERQMVRIPQRVDVHRLTWLLDQPRARRMDAPGMSTLLSCGLVGLPPRPRKPEISGMTKRSEEAVGA